MEAHGSRVQIRGAWEAVVYLLHALTFHRPTWNQHLGTSVLEEVVAAHPVLSCVSQVLISDNCDTYLRQAALAVLESRG